MAVKNFNQIWEPIRSQSDQIFRQYSLYAFTCFKLRNANNRTIFCIFKIGLLSSRKLKKCLWISLDFQFILCNLLCHTLCYFLMWDYWFLFTKQHFSNVLPVVKILFFPYLKRQNRWKTILFKVSTLREKKPYWQRCYPHDRRQQDTLTSLQVRSKDGPAF